MNKRAFSLVELSIVLVILGLLVGGILAGQSLIRASELRAATAEYQRYNTAVHAFRDRYFAIPGDMNNATAVWGTSTACSGASATGTCNGNGDRLMNSAGAPSVSAELFQFWRQLASAGLIEGSYSGLAGPGSAVNAVLDNNVPRSRLNNTGWATRNVTGFGGNSAAYAMDYQNMFYFGAASPTDTLTNPILKPEEAWNIDTKLDDGKPGMGNIIMLSSSYPWGNANACTTSTSFSDYAGNYNLASSTIACSLQFPKAY